MGRVQGDPRVTERHAMRNPRMAKTIPRRRRDADAALAVAAALAQREQERFRQLGYRFVHSTDPEEQSRLKDELVRSLLRRLSRRPKTKTREAEVC